MALPFCVAGFMYSYSSCVLSLKILEKSAQPQGLPVYGLKTLVPVAFALLGLAVVRNLVAGIAQLRSGQFDTAPHSDGAIG